MMESWPPLSLNERRSKSNNYRSYSSFEDSGEEVVVCDDDVLVQSDPFRNGRSLSIEGCNIQYINVIHEEHFEFNSHLSDDSRQDASTTHVHMISMLNELQKCKK